MYDDGQLHPHDEVDELDDDDKPLKHDEHKENEKQPDTQLHIYPHRPLPHPLSLPQYTDSTASLDTSNDNSNDNDDDDDDDDEE